MTALIDVLNLGNDADIEVGQLMRHVAATGVNELDTGLVNLTAFWALTDTDTAPSIHAVLTLTLIERIPTPTAIYYNTWTGALLTTHLTAYLGQTIYQQVKRGTVLHSAKPFIVGYRKHG